MLEIFEEYKNKIAVIDGDKKYTYNDIKNQIAAEIEELKKKKENVVILSGDNFSFIIQFFASLYCGKNIYLITDKTRLKDLNFDFDILEKVTGKIKENYSFPEIDTQTGAVNFFTSGSSGIPKPIKKSLFNLVEEGKDIGLTFNLKGKTLTFKSTTTMCHLFGTTFHLMTPLCNGLTIDTKEVSYPENMDIENGVLVSTPAFLRTVKKHNLSFKIPPEYIISAGSKLDEDVFEILEKKSNIIEIYGSSETGVIANKTHFDDDFRVFDKVKLKVTDDFVEVYSNYAFGGKTKINDKIEVENGRLKFKTRTDRLFKINEKRVSADELEKALTRNDFVNNCYITQKDNKLLCLCALNKNGQEYAVKNGVTDLTKNLKQYLLKFSEIIPQRWKFIDEIPMNTMGKIDKKFIGHIFDVNLSIPLILDRQEENENITYKLHFYKQCNFFRGHFPSFMLVPGVVQLYIAKEFANYHYNIDIGQGQWKRIKFSNIIRPDSIINLKLAKTDKNVSFEYFYENEKYASGIFLCENIFKDLWSNKE